MNRYELRHVSRRYLTTDIFRGQYFVLKPHIPSSYPPIIRTIFIEDEMFIYREPKLGSRRQRIDMNTLEAYYTQQDGRPIGRSWNE
jgi:hypothetical protein